jgi:tRNA (adenine57-N1/adenine58-N1)-methyltransferase
MIKAGDLVILYDGRTKFLVKVGSDKFHGNHGYIEHKQLVGKEFGEEIRTHLGYSFVILSPVLEDLTMKVKRESQIVYPKDIGIILVKSGIFPGAKVVEVGTGSGSLTIALANFVRPNGKVITYEKRKDFAEIARGNLGKAGLEKFVQIKNQEVNRKIKEKNIDFVMLDLPNPWDIISHVRDSLKEGRRICCLLPTIDQVMEAVFYLEENGFTAIETVEIWMREILVRKGKTRPEQNMPSHTAYLIFGTKIK